MEANEEPLEAAQREFREETGFEAAGPFLELGSVRLKSGKIIHAWAWEGDADAASIRSNIARLEWPRGSGRWITYPEVDRCGWFGGVEARNLLNPSQAGLIERLERLITEDPATPADAPATS
jgi:predicted NUDIX family NTP pyrophosphohydrolase